MPYNGILPVCIAAFIAIFFLLSLLSAMMRLLIYLFPRTDVSDSAAVAAIVSTYHSVYPGSKVTRIEEKR